MIYSFTLMLTDPEILVVSVPTDATVRGELLGDSRRWMSIWCAVRPAPTVSRRRFIIGARSWAATRWRWSSATTSSPATASACSAPRQRAAPTLFVLRQDPERYGVVRLDGDGPIDVEDEAALELRGDRPYFYDDQVLDITADWAWPAGRLRSPTSTMSTYESQAAPHELMSRGYACASTPAPAGGSSRPRTSSRSWSSGKGSIACRRSRSASATT